MAAITIPTPIQTTATVLGGYVYNGNTADTQTLLDDTDYTCSNYELLYKGVPIFSAFASGKLNLASRFNITGTNSNTYYCDCSDKIYIYDFDTFTVFSAMVVLTDVSSSSKHLVILDKTNCEVFDGFQMYGKYGILGLMFNYLDNSVPKKTNFYPIDDSHSNSISQNTNTLRQESTSDAEYIKLIGATGKQATRMYFFTKFPRASSNNVLHVGDKYFYLFPIYETVGTYYTSPSTSIQQENFCTMGIDVTAEINAQ